MPPLKQLIQTRPQMSVTMLNICIRRGLVTAVVLKQRCQQRIFLDDQNLGKRSF